MSRSVLTLASIAAGALCLTACGDTSSTVEGDAETTVPEPAQDSSRAADAPESADGVNDGFPDLTPSRLEPDVERTETGARNVLLSFARALELSEYDQAWELLSQADQEKWPREQFANAFSDLREITVSIPAGAMEGAAGSAYYTAPITIEGDDLEGRPILYEGEIVLRRVNDVPGASEDQLRWHMESVTLDWTH